LRGDQDYQRSWGFPINTNFKSVEDLWYLVRQTGMHAINKQDVEFAMAVHIKAWPCGILSVWVYLAAWTDKQEHN
jgi:hypothetical protein